MRTLEERIIHGMNVAMTSKGRTFVWNPCSKFNVKRKIKDVRLTFGIILNCLFGVLFLA